MMRPGSFHGTRTTGPCCISMVRLSHPECAMTSAEKELGTCNHPFTAVSPSRQIFFRRFSLTLDLLLQRHTDASCNPVDVVGRQSLHFAGGAGPLSDSLFESERIPAHRRCFHRRLARPSL